MNHARFKEWIELSVIDELADDERSLLDLHLKECLECRTDLKAFQEFSSVVAGQKPPEVSDALLREARRELRFTLLQMRLEKSLAMRMVESLREFVIREYKIALGGTAMAALGVLIGYFVLVPRGGNTDTTPRSVEPVAQQAMQTAGTGESFTQGDTRTSNLRFIESNASGDLVEFTFDAITPMHVRGSVDDEKVQKVLARALTNEDNPGVRLRSVSAIASRAGDRREADPDVKTALISALKGDQNPGVRQEALRALLQYPIDGEIKQALKYTLMHDKNSGNRIAAINGLASATVDGHRIDEGILNVLRQKIQSDHNNYVRRQARTVVEEVAHR